MPSSIYELDRRRDKADALLMKFEAAAVEAEAMARLKFPGFKSIRQGLSLLWQALWTEKEKTRNPEDDDLTVQESIKAVKGLLARTQKFLGDKLTQFDKRTDCRTLNRQRFLLVSYCIKHCKPAYCALCF